MTKKPKETHEYWKIKQFCSSDCYGNFLEGKSKPENLGEKNGQWRGKDVSYGALHDYIKWHLPKPDKCERCGKNKRLDLANISQEYKRDLSDWEWLCRLCHMTKDGRLEKTTKMLIENRRQYLKSSKESKKN